MRILAFLLFAAAASPLAAAQRNYSVTDFTRVRIEGPFAVTLSYLTIGIQTAVHLTAGVMRMPLRFYLPAAVVGSAAWAVLYATIGLAVVQAWIAAEAGSWWGVAALAALLAAGVATWVVRNRRREPDAVDETGRPLTD